MIKKKVERNSNSVVPVFYFGEKKQNAMVDFTKEIVCAKNDCDEAKGTVKPVHKRKWARKRGKNEKEKDASTLGWGSPTLQSTS